MKATLAMAMTIAATSITGCSDKATTTAPAAAPASAAQPHVARLASSVAPAPKKESEGSAVAKNAEGTAIAPDAGARDAQGSVANAPQADSDDDDPATPSRDPERFFEKVTEPAMATDDKRLGPMKIQLEKQLEMPVTLLRPIAHDDSVYALYEHALHDAPIQELNPECNGYGLAHARFEGSSKEPLQIDWMPLEMNGCDPKIRHWFVGERNSRTDAVLEVVSSHVTERAGGKETLSRQQLLVLWSPTADNQGGDRFTQELASWTVKPGESEPPTLDSFLFHGLGPGSQIAVVHLLPCYLPWGERSCATELRKRTYSTYGGH